MPPPAPAAPEPRPSPPSERADCRMAGAIGTELSTPLQTMQQTVQQLLGTGKLSRRQVNALLDAIDTAQRTTRHALLLDRLTHTPIKQSHEHVPLAVLLQHTLAERANWLQGRAVDVVPRLEAATVVQDPALLDSLLDAALCWMARPGYRLLVSLELTNWPPHAQITFKSRPLVSGASTRPQEAPEAYRLSGQLLDTCAQLSGVLVRRVDSPELLQLTLEFPRTVQRLQALTQLDIELGGEPEGELSSRSPRGQHLLLVSADAGLAAEVRQITEEMGVILTQVPTVERAARCCELDPPQLLVLDLRLPAPELAALRQGLLRREGPVPCIELTEDQHTLAMSSWEADSVAKVSRHNLRTRLPPVLVREFGKLG